MISKEILDKIDQFIARCNASEDDDALRKCFIDTPEFQLPVCDIDPFSSTYKEFILDVYKCLAGRQYKADNEYSDYKIAIHNIEDAIDTKYFRPFPFYTHSPKTVARELRSIGDIIQHIPRKHGAKILELGAGDGLLGECLLRMGYNVSFVEINPVCCNVLNRRCKKLGTGRAVWGDSNKVDTYFSDKMDVIIFYKSFHHHIDFIPLIDKLKALLKEDGILILAGESIIKNWHQPWGLRNDSQAIWSIRRNGWMELGFDHDFFLSLLFNKGLKARIFPGSLLPIYIFSHLENGFSPAIDVFPAPYEDSFYPSDTSSNNSVRHTRSHIVLPIPTSNALHSFECSSIILDVISYKPGEHLISIETEPDSLVYSLSNCNKRSLHVDVKGTQALHIMVPKWIPNDFINNLDQRELGIVIEKIQYKY